MLSSPRSRVRHRFHRYILAVVVLFLPRLAHTSEQRTISVIIVDAKTERNSQHFVLNKKLMVYFIGSEVHA